jgi:hypothetical protein
MTDTTPTPPTGPPAEDRPKRGFARRHPFLIALVVVLFFVGCVGVLGGDVEPEPTVIAEEQDNTVDVGGLGQEPSSEPSPEPERADFAQLVAETDVDAIDDCEELSAIFDESEELADPEGADAEALRDFHSALLDRMDIVCEEDPEAEETGALAIGDSAQLGPEFEDATHTVTVSEVRRTTKPYDSEYGQGPASEVFVIFTVEVQAATSSSVYSDDFYIVTRDGQRVDTLDGNSYEAIDFNDELGYVELDAGQHKQGLLAFDSPTKHGTLNYNPNFEGEPIATWEF